MAQVLRKRVKRDPGLTHDFKPVTLQTAPLSGTPDHRPWGTNISYSHPKPPNGQEICISFFFSASPNWKKAPPRDSTRQPGDHGLARTPFCPRLSGSFPTFLIL